MGKAILGPLRELDEVAYLRFASVYRSFESADDFEDEIALLRANAPIRWLSSERQRALETRRTGARLSPQRLTTDRPA